MSGLYIIFIWWLIGFCSHIYWFRYEFDIDMEAIFIGFFIGFIGPFMWIIGWMEFSPKVKKILWKKRAKKVLWKKRK